MRFTLPGAALIALTSVLTACGPDDSARTITVPGDAGTIQAAVDDARPGDTVLIAGKGHETYQEFEDTVVPFDDRVHAEEALEELGWTEHPLAKAA